VLLKPVTEWDNAAGRSLSAYKHARHTGASLLRNRRRRRLA